MRQLYKFLCLTGAERSLLVSAIIYLVGIRLGLMVLPFGKLVSMSKMFSKRKVRGKDNGLSPEQIGWAVGAVSRYLPGMRNCLVQALAIYLMLARRNYPAHLRIGVAKDESGRLKAHAWVESEDRVITDRAGALQFTALPNWEMERDEGKRR